MKPKAQKKKEKVFECKNGCKKQYIDMVVLGCQNCIKKTAPMLTEKQLSKIAEILINP